MRSGIGDARQRALRIWAAYMAKSGFVRSYISSARVGSMYEWNTKRAASSFADDRRRTIEIKGKLRKVGSPDRRVSQETVKCNIAFGPGEPIAAMSLIMANGGDKSMDIHSFATLELVTKGTGTSR